MFPVRFVHIDISSGLFDCGRVLSHKVQHRLATIVENVGALLDVCDYHVHDRGDIGPGTVHYNRNETV